MFRRGRRLRDTAIIRDLVRENELSVKDFILPIFVVEGENIKREISSLKGNYHWSVDRLGELVKELKETGVRSVIIFGVPEHKDCKGTEAYNENGIVQKAIRKLRELDDELYPDLGLPFVSANTPMTYSHAPPLISYIPYIFFVVEASFPRSVSYVPFVTDLLLPAGAPYPVI